MLYLVTEALHFPTAIIFLSYFPFGRKMYAFGLRTGWLTQRNNSLSR